MWGGGMLSRPHSIINTIKRPGNDVLRAKESIDCGRGCESIQLRSYQGKYYLSLVP